MIVHLTLYVFYKEKKKKTFHLSLFENHIKHDIV